MPIRKLFKLPLWIIFFQSVSSGLPLLAIGSTLQAWMVSSEVDIKVIGLYALVGLPYTWKFAWSFIFDHFSIPFFGRRRGWILLTQVILVFLFLLLSVLDPRTSLGLIALVTFLIAFASASQDIVLDAYRRDVLLNNQLAIGSSIAVGGYRIGMLISGALALYLVKDIGWSGVYQMIAVAFGVGILSTIFAPEPVISGQKRTFLQSVKLPLKDFFANHKAWWLLLFILLFKIGDSMASAMLTPFILNSGFNQTQLAEIGKIYGMAATITGGFLGGFFLLRLDLRKGLFIFGFLQAISTAGFILLSTYPGSISALIAVISFENLSSGMGTAAFVAFMASLTNREFSATQYALLSSMSGVPRVIFSAATGYLVSIFGYDFFFVFCSIIALPGLLMVPWVFQGRSESISN